MKRAAAVSQGHEGQQPLLLEEAFDDWKALVSVSEAKDPKFSFPSFLTLWCRVNNVAESDVLDWRHEPYTAFTTSSRGPLLVNSVRAGCPCWYPIVVRKKKSQVKDAEKANKEKANE